MTTVQLAAAPERARPVSAELAARLAPTLTAAVLAAVYVLVSPPSLDLAAHLFRAQLFHAEGFGLWDNWWYGGHDILGYSVLFPAVSAALTPQLAAALAVTATAAMFDSLARRHYGRDAWLGAVVFGAAVAGELYCGRLAFAFGALPALGAVLALDHRRSVVAAGLAALSALCSPVAGLFAAVAAAAYALGAISRGRRIDRQAMGPAGVAVAAVAPPVALAIIFPEGGSMPFAFSAMLPIPVLAALALAGLQRDRERERDRDRATLRAGIALYALLTLGVYAVASPIGSNVVRLGTLLVGPLAGLELWPRRRRLLAVVTLPLLYLGFQAPVANLAGAAGDSSTTTAYYTPLLRFLQRESVAPAPPFRIEIPPTRDHWEAYAVATRFPLARGWERQLDIADNPLFYRGRLGAAAYDRWLHANAVRFVAAPDAPLDYSAHAEMGLIDRGLPYLRLVMHSRHWRVFAVTHPTPIVAGPAILRTLGPDRLSLRATAAGALLVRVRFSPYWALSRGSGCVAPAGPYTRLILRRPGAVTLGIDFSLARIGARSPRCT